MSHVDPICGAEVDPAKTPYKTMYKGKIYYFCCKHCLRVFEENPEYYIIQGSERP